MELGPFQTARVLFSIHVATVSSFPIEVNLKNFQDHQQLSSSNNLQRNALVRIFLKLHSAPKRPFFGFFFF